MWHPPSTTYHPHSKLSIHHSATDTDSGGCWRSPSTLPPTVHTREGECLPGSSGGQPLAATQHSRASRIQAYRHLAGASFRGTHSRTRSSDSGQLCSSSETCRTNMKAAPRCGSPPRPSLEEEKSKRPRPGVCKGGWAEGAVMLGYCCHGPRICSGG